MSGFDVNQVAARQLEDVTEGDAQLRVARPLRAQPPEERDRVVEAALARVQAGEGGGRRGLAVVACQQRLPPGDGGAHVAAGAGVLLGFAVGVLQ